MKNKKNKKWVRITVYGMKIYAHMEKDNTHYAIRNMVYGLLIYA